MRYFTIPLRRLGGFTLIELLTVMAVIAILAGLILSISGFATNKGARARATAEIKALESACDNYKADNGTYPDIVTSGTYAVTPASFASNIPSDNLDPRAMGNPTTSYSGTAGTVVTYANTSYELYVALTSDTTGYQQTVRGARNYLTDIKPDMLGRNNPSAAVSSTNTVTYLSDPFGNSYGYSTANAFYQSCLLQSGTAGTGRTAPGYNSTFDLWSTGTQINAPYNGTGPLTSGSAGDPMLQWIKNW